MIRRVGRPGLIGLAARTAVVAGTASAVSGGVQRRQQDKAQQEYEAQQYQQQQQWEAQQAAAQQAAAQQAAAQAAAAPPPPRSERHTSQLQSLWHLQSRHP
ncbi:SHOCT domain-containing protein, partial [Agromyces seonyuensis]|uniref:SHOCT domain-containing protein n=1 Tax=Agromyces seonyuensis TaxID=2662446 RepID=UPI001F25B6A8